MRTDPRAACANSKERWGWAIAHDLVAHPFMALTNYSTLALRLHDWTSFHAWPRTQSSGPRQPVEVVSRWGVIVATEVAPRCWSVKHPRVNHAIVLGADDAVAAVEQAEQWFQILADDFGGKFDPVASLQPTPP